MYIPLSFLFQIIEEQKCAEFNGIASNAGKECCAMECGKCGGTNCGARHGGKQACCTQSIPKRQICGVNNQKAPCHIKGKQDFGL